MDDLALTSRLATLSASFLAELESGPRARLLALEVDGLLTDAAVLVYLIDESTPAWRIKAVVGEVSIDRGPIALNSGSLGVLLERQENLRIPVDQLVREDFLHLDVRQSVNGLLYIPLLLKDRVLGCIEIVSFSAPTSDTSLALIRELANHAAIALDASLRYESERNAGLSSVLRLTQLYDIEKVFNATLEMQELLPIICSKVQDLLKATAVNLWMIDEDNLLLMERAGDDPAATLGDRRIGSGTIVGDVGETGEAVLVQDGEEALLLRSDAPAEEAAVSVMAVPLIHGDDLTGVLEVVRYRPAQSFGEDDLFTLTQVAGSAAQALHNSSLLQAERKIEILRTLVNVSQEITSTLNLQRVLEAIVNQPQLVIPYERAVIALEQRNRISVQAISGVTKFDPSSGEVQTLNRLLEWIAGLETGIFVSQHSEEISDTRPETREKFRRYFETSGSRSFYAVPLGDDEGRLGLLSFESSDPDFLTTLHFEIIKVLASQATLALRNASLYKEVPFIGILEPLLEKRRRFMAIGKRRRALVFASVAGLLLALVLVPFPMRVSGHAEVSPSQVQYVHAEEDSIVRQAFVREGDKVQPGTPLLQMADWGQRANLASARAKYNTATAQMNRALVNNDATTAGQDQLEAEYERGEVTRLSDRLSRMTLRSEIAGVVATPHVENLVGKKLSDGDPLIELVSTDNVIVDIAVPERDVDLIKAGSAADVKLESLPADTFRGTVNIISPAGTTVGDNHLFFARIALPNTDGRVKPGMQGAGKIRVGLRPLGYVLFRDPALWVWSRLWNWFSW